MSEEVTRYYDGNTRSFLRFGRGGRATGAIHRALRAPGVRTQEDALNYVHHLIAEALKRATGDASAGTGDAGSGDTLRTSAGSDAGTVAGAGIGTGAGTATTPLLTVADLGCGVGAGMAWLSRRVPGRYVGVTISSVQAEIAAGRTAADGQEPFPVVVGSFDDPGTLRQAAARTVVPSGEIATPRTEKPLLDAAYMIESFVHGSDAATTLAAIAEVMRPGGVLIVCDDLPTDDLLAMTTDADGSSGNPASAAAASGAHPAATVTRFRRSVAEFRTGWHINTFVSVARLEEIANRHGFVLERSVDLSAYVVVDRPRDYLLRLVAGPAGMLGFNSPRWQNIRGGNALQYLEKAGLMDYRLLTLRRV